MDECRHGHEGRVRRHHGRSRGCFDGPRNIAGQAIKVRKADLASAAAARDRQSRSLPRAKVRISSLLNLDTIFAARLEKTPEWVYVIGSRPSVRRLILAVKRLLTV